MQYLAKHKPQNPTSTMEMWKIREQEMCIRDRPMVIHTKEKAKIHAHEPKGAKIKGSNIYTVERGPKAVSYTHLDVYKRQGS